VKTTVELPDELVRAVKLRAVSEGRRLKDTLAELIRRGLDAEEEPGAQGQRPGPEVRRVHLPLVACAHRARPATEMTPERTAEVLLAQEAEAVSGQS
jgi:hypothetical protein